MRASSPCATLAAIAVAGCAFGACAGDDLPPLKAPPPPTFEAPAVASTAPASTRPRTTHAAPKKSKEELRNETLDLAVAAFDAHDAGKLSTAYADAAVLTVYGVIERNGKDAIQIEHAGYLRAFPDMKMGIARVYETDDIWAIEWSFSGTQSGEFMKLRPKGVAVGARALSLLWFDDAGKITKEHRYLDVTTLREQIQRAQTARTPPDVPTGPPDRFARQGIPTPDDEKLVASTDKLFEAADAGGATDALDAFVADDAHGDALWLAPTSMRDRRGVLDAFTQVARALPDRKYSAATTIVLQGYVIREWTLSGTLRDAVAGVRPSGRAVALHGAHVLKWSADQKLHVATVYADRDELLRQTGVLPRR